MGRKIFAAQTDVRSCFFFQKKKSGHVLPKKKRKRKSPNPLGCRQIYNQRGIEGKREDPKYPWLLCLKLCLLNELQTCLGQSPCPPSYAPSSPLFLSLKLSQLAMASSSTMAFLVLTSPLMEMPWSHQTASLSSPMTQLI